VSNLENIKNNWEKFGKEDPLWAVSAFKNHKGGKWNEEEFFQRGIDEIDMVMNHIKSLNVELDYRKALDFGCGVGRLTQAIARYYNTVDGVDIAQSMIDLATKYNKFGDRVKYIFNCADDLHVLEGTAYDFIYTSDVLQHIDSKYSKAYLKGFIDHLSPKGLLVFQIPSEDRRIIINYLYAKLGIHNYFGNIRGKLKSEPFMEYHYIKKEEVKNFIHNNNGRIVDIMNDPRGNVISYRYFVTKD
jgi:2-polyprenyl-3-methyl-5-hydroxy-6-metoxy-1,4-benzoquinol methylase